jgi:hypothetical protein
MAEPHYRVAIPAPLTAATVIVEDGTVVLTANCYIDVAYAEAFHQGSLYNDQWETADAEQKAASIISATRAIDANVAFNGYLVDPAQPLKWPRLYCPQAGVYMGYPYGGYPIGMGQGAYGYWPSNMIPKVLKDATALEALELLRLDRLADNSAQGIASMTVDVISLSFKQGSGSDAGGAFLPLSSQVAAMLDELGIVSSAGGFSIIPVCRVP